MPRTDSPPSYRLHRARNFAVMTINGKNHYLGAYGSPESHEKYARLVGEWQANRRRAPIAQTGLTGSTRTVSVSPSALTVSELILAFFEHARRHYRHADGTPTGELDNFRDALRPLRRLYGSTLAKDFGPLALRAVREESSNPSGISVGCKYGANPGVTGYSAGYGGFSPTWTLRCPRE
jgi:hypothetical protein